MPNDQVRIKFGPARYDSPKAIRRQIEDAKTEAEETTITRLVNDPDIDLGGSASRRGEIGAALELLDENGIFVDSTYDNASGTTLAPGDGVIFTELEDGGYAVLGVTFRGGSINVNQPIVQLSVNFPLQTDLLPFPINPGVNSIGDALAHEMIGSAGYGADLILGPSTSAFTTLNGFSRDTASSIALPNPPASYKSIHVTPSGRIILVRAGNIYWLDPGSSTWSSQGFVSTFWDSAYDPSNGSFWVTSVGAGGIGAFYRLLESDVSVVNAGTLGIAASTSAQVSMSAAGGTLVLVYAAAGVNRYASKPSGTTANFTISGSTFTNTAWARQANPANASNPNGDISYLYDSGLSGNVHIRTIIPSPTFVITDTDTGIPSASFAFQSMLYSNSGLAVITLAGDSGFFGGASGQWIPVIATNNMVSTNYVYLDLAHWGGAFTDMDVTRPNEVSVGTMRFGASNSSSLSNGDYYVYELTGF